MGGGQDAQAMVSWPQGVKKIRAGAKIPREILPHGGQAACGSLDPRGSNCPEVKINRYTGSIIERHKNLIAHPQETDLG